MAVSGTSVGGFWEIDRATMDQMFTYLPVALSLFVIPRVTMRSLAAEKRSGTLELLITMPVQGQRGDPRQVPRGARRWCSSCSRRRCSTRSRCSSGPGTSASLDWGPVWSGYLGLRLFLGGAAVGVGLMFSSLTESEVIAFFLTTRHVRHPLRARLARVESCTARSATPSTSSRFQARFQPFARGLIDTRAVVYFVSIADPLPARELPLAREPEVVLSLIAKEPEMAMEKRKKTAVESGVLILIVAAILVAVNALSALGMYARSDVTKTEKFTLSKGSGNLLRSMKQQLTVDAYVTQGLPKLDAFVRDLRDLLQEYKNAGGGKFDYTIIEPKDEDTKKKAKDAGLIEQPFGEASDTDEKAAVAQGFMGLVFKYGEQKDVIKFLPPDRTDGLEFWITNKIREIRDKGDDIQHKIGVLTGHDEIKLVRQRTSCPARWASTRCRRSSRRTSPSTRSRTWT